VRSSRITIPVAAIAPALLLGAASAAPSAALATTGSDTDRAPHQYYWPSSSGYYGWNGYGGYYGTYPYEGSGTAAWYGWGAYPGSYWGAGYYPGSYGYGGYYPGGYGYWNWFDSSPYEGSPGYPYYDYGPHYSYGGPAYVTPSYGTWAPGY
jgi:hypothetical protein